MAKSPITLRIETATSELDASTVRKDARVAQDLDYVFNNWLVDVPGWFDIPAEIRITAEKINGDGLYAASKARRSGRAFEVIIQHVASPGKNATLFREWVRDLAMDGGFVKVTLTYELLGEPCVEVIHDAWIDGEVLWEQDAPNHARVLIPFKAKSPKKTRIFQGETTRTL